ncbi:26S proteasome complex subunit SEM1 [Coemansia thaxteri]|uniref:26S proteasome complex subunit SEM1 n=1 Tax=Coemansia thaxteri TaxID=2663907 RepID=A0A9W8BJX0_9FUNG|nr:26S proteasome complex subunit SEM1 [Coemansia thaxteri]KAJ2484237.1 26S proteasome complex subunit SEM1 [Coemansia sp. RSA 2320]
MSTQQNAPKDSKAEKAAASADQTAKKLPTMGALEEDDEFEEFEVEDWNEDAEDKEDISLWDDNWDDDDLEDDFSKQLRNELEKASRPEAMAVTN